MTDLTAGAARANDDLFATTSKTSSGFAWSEKAKPLSAGILKGCLYLFILGQVVSIFAPVVMLWAVQIWQRDGGIDNEMVATVAGLVGTGAQYLPYVSIGIFVLCVIFYLMFVYRATKNLELSNARGLEMSPGAAVGWSFVPIANLGTVYNAMKGIWIASMDPVKGTKSASAKLGIWWGLYLVGNIIGRISDAMVPAGLGEDPATIFDQFLFPAIVGITGSLCAIASTLVLHSMVSEIVRAQDLMRSTKVFED
jgi:hypothetical protein